MTAAPDGSFWSTNSENVITRYDATGSPLWQKAVLTLPGAIIDCMRATDAGLVVTGSFSKIYPVANVTDWKTFPISAPFIARIAPSGQLVSEETVHEGGEAVYTSYASGITHQCDALTVSKEGVVTYVFSASKIIGASVHDQKLALPDDPFSAPREIDDIIVQRGPTGSIGFRSILSPNADQPHLFTSNGHYFLVERLQPKRSDTKNPLGLLVNLAEYKTQIGLRFTELDVDLRIVSSAKLYTTDNEMNMTSAIHLPDGGYAVAGCSMTIPINSLQIYSSRGTRLSTTRWGKSNAIDECAPTALALGPTPGTVAMYMFSDEHGERIDTFKVDTTQP